MHVLYHSIIKKYVISQRLLVVVSFYLNDEL